MPEIYRSQEVAISQKELYQLDKDISKYQSLISDNIKKANSGSDRQPWKRFGKSKWNVAQ